MDFLRTFLTPLQLNTYRWQTAGEENITFHRNSRRVYVVRPRHLTIVTLPRLKYNTTGSAADIMEGNSYPSARVTSEILIGRRLKKNVFIANVLSLNVRDP